MALSVLTQIIQTTLFGSERRLESSREREAIGRRRPPNINKLVAQIPTDHHKPDEAEYNSKAESHNKRPTVYFPEAYFDGTWSETIDPTSHAVIHYPHHRIIQMGKEQKEPRLEPGKIDRPMNS